MGLLSLLFYYVFAYHLERTDFIKLLSLFAALFFICYKLIQFEKWNGKLLFGIGLLSRFVFLLIEPTLSQDYYRFIWDGQLVSNFINPYLNAPDQLISQSDLIIANAQELYNGMGALSAQHFSNYPPLNQVIFGIAAWIGGKSILGSIVVMRGIVILADIGILYFGRKLLKNLNRSPHLIFWYFLNPLVIIELTGNLHFEGVMLFLFILSMYLLSKGKWQLAGVLLACSISVKLVPILFLPLFLKHFGLKKSIVFYLIVGATSVVLFAPFYTSEFIANYSKTLVLWFSNFEFNAGIYNGIKRIAMQGDAKPWELIKTYGKITPIITIVSVILFTVLRKNEKIPVLLSSMLWVLTIYYLLAAAVHPWYIIFLVLLGGLTEYKFAILWSAAIVLSYYAYSQPDFKENLWLLAIEYISLYAFIGYEMVLHRNKK